MGTVLIRHPLIQLDSGVIDLDCKSKMVRGLNREGVGDRSSIPIKTSPCRAPWRVKRIAIEYY